LGYIKHDFRTREERRPVLIRARMRYGASWKDICILNLSSRGMMVRSCTAPLPGSYVEVRRGNHVIVARVVWSGDQKFGVLTQDRLPVDAIASGAAVAKPVADIPAERRSTPRRPNRLDDRHAASRLTGRLLEYGFLLIVGVSAAVGGFVTVQEAFASPLDLVSNALSGEEAKPPAPNP
jgi:hypothetical protein